MRIPLIAGKYTQLSEKRTLHSFSGQGFRA
jgi:hypothetical protein